MHWFDSKLKTLHKLAEVYENFRLKNSDKFVDEIRQARTVFISSVQELVDSVVMLPDVAGCVAGHDGFILAKAGVISGLDGLGAMIQESMDVAERNQAVLELGTIQQIVIIGENNKIAMISVGQITIGILSSKDINLSLSLSKNPS